MFARIENDTVVEFPVYNLRAHLPQCSLPDDLTKPGVLPDGWVLVEMQPLPDIDRADLIVLIGENPAVSHMSFVSMPAPMQRLKAAGVQFHRYSDDIMKGAYKAANELYDEESAKNPKFKKMYESWKAFLDEEFLWFRVAESPYENFVYQQAAAAARAK